MDVTAYEAVASDEELTLTELYATLPIAIKTPIRITFGVGRHVFTVGILVVALAGCVAAWCTMIMWIYLFWWQMKLLLVTATLLRSCLEEPEAIDISKITPAVLHPPSDVKRELKAHNESRITPAVLQPPNDVQQQQRETDGSHPQIEQPDSQVHTEQVDTRVHDFDEEKNKLYNRIMQRERDIEEAIAASEQQEVHMANDEDNGIPNGVDTLEQQDSHQEHMPPPECDGDAPAPTATVETVKPKAVVATSALRALSKEEKKDQAQTSWLTKLNAGSLTVPKARHDHERPSVGAQKPSTGDSTISSASPNPWNCDPEQIAEAAAFNSTATKGGHKQKPSAAASGSKQSTTVRARQQSSSLLVSRSVARAISSTQAKQVSRPKRTATAVAQPNVLAQTTNGQLPPHLRRAKEVRESRASLEEDARKENEHHTGKTEEVVTEPTLMAASKNMYDVLVVEPTPPAPSSPPKPSKTTVEIGEMTKGLEHSVHAPKVSKPPDTSPPPPIPASGTMSIDVLKSFNVPVPVVGAAVDTFIQFKCCRCKKFSSLFPPPNQANDDLCPNCRSSDARIDNTQKVIDGITQRVAPSSGAQKSTERKDPGTFIVSASYFLTTMLAVNTVVLSPLDQSTVVEDEHVFDAKSSADEPARDAGTAVVYGGDPDKRADELRTVPLAVPSDDVLVTRSGSAKSDEGHIPDSPERIAAIEKAVTVLNEQAHHTRGSLISVDKTAAEVPTVQHDDSPKSASSSTGYYHPDLLDLDYEDGPASQPAFTPSSSRRVLGLAPIAPPFFAPSSRATSVQRGPQQAVIEDDEDDVEHAPQPFQYATPPQACQSGAHHDWGVGQQPIYGYQQAAPQIPYPVPTAAPTAQYYAAGYGSDSWPRSAAHFPSRAVPIVRPSSAAAVPQALDTRSENAFPPLPQSSGVQNYMKLPPYRAPPSLDIKSKDAFRSLPSVSKVETPTKAVHLPTARQTKSTNKLVAAESGPIVRNQQRPPAVGTSKTITPPPGLEAQQLNRQAVFDALLTDNRHDNSVPTGTKTVGAAPLAESQQSAVNASAASVLHTEQLAPKDGKSNCSKDDFDGDEKVTAGSHEQAAMFEPGQPASAIDRNVMRDESGVIDADHQASLDDAGPAVPARELNTLANESTIAEADDQPDTNKTEQPDDEANPTSVKQARKKKKKTARDTVLAMWWSRELARKKALGTSSLENMQALEAATKLYSDKRAELAGCMGNGVLNEQDALNFLAIPASDLSAPKRRPAGAEDAYFEAKAAEEAPAPSSPAIQQEPEEDSELSKLRENAQIALNNYDRYIAYCKGPPPQGRRDLRQAAAEAEAKVERTRKFYFKKRKALRDRYPQDAWLGYQLPAELPSFRGVLLT